MDRYRLIATIVVLLIYLLSMFPTQTIVVAFLLAVAYFILKNLHSGNVENDSKTRRRRSALNEAKIYLAPYNDIWRNLRLSNKYCTLKLGPDGHSITAYDVNNNRSFKVVKSLVHSRNDLWDMFCVSFGHNTSFDELINLCHKFAVDIDLRDDEAKSANSVPNNQLSVNESENLSSNVQYSVINYDNNAVKKEKLDVNNASEVELTALPGISIVMSKKLIKKREEIGGFKTVKDVFLFLNLKPHLQSQLESLICVNKMKGSVGIKRYNERSIDL